MATRLTVHSRTLTGEYNSCEFVIAMDLRSIRYFVQIAELGSITRASEHLGIAQPALSRHVRSVEDELGTQLLVRVTEEIHLTKENNQ